MHSRTILVGVLCLIVGLFMGGIYLFGPPEPSQSVEPMPWFIALLRGEETLGFARAFEPRPFSFPADWGPHPEYRIEWWYVTGNLETEDKRHFGYQLTFFRFALTPNPEERESAWGANQVYMAHFALTDVEAAQFYAYERFSRAALSLAGAKAQPFEVWLENWSIRGTDGDVLPMQLRAAQESVSINLTLESAKNVVLQGNKGLSYKSTEVGNASYYYSLTRMPTRGTIQIEGETFDLKGLSWFDREWSTSALGKDTVGWDWFSIQLDDERELMFYLLRQRDGRAAPSSDGILISADGSTRRLTRDAVQIAVLSHWQSPLDETRYPSRWRMDIESEGLSLNIKPYLANQELTLSVRYWEGAVQVKGRSFGHPVSGNGYVELTGYGRAEDWKEGRLEGGKGEGHTQHTRQ